MSVCAQLPTKLQTPWLCSQYYWTPWLCIIVWTKPVICNSKYLLMRAIQAETNKKWQWAVSKMCNMQNPGITMHETSKTEKSFCICMKNGFYSWSIYSLQQSSSVTHTHMSLVTPTSEPDSHRLSLSLSLSTLGCKMHVRKRKRQWHFKTLVPGCWLWCDVCVCAFVCQ